MSVLQYAPSLFSSLFRLCSYVFLEVLPHHQGKVVLPTLYVLYITSLYFQPQSKPAHVNQTLIVVESKPQEVLAEEHQVIEQETLQISLESAPAFPSSKSSWSLHDAVGSLLLSLPSPFISISVLNFIINTLLLFAVADFVFYPLYDDAADVIYTRVGAVYPDAAKIVVRYPDYGNREVLLQWRQTSVTSSDFDDEPWIDGPVLNLTETDDWVSTVTLNGLWPSTYYQYRLAYPNGTTLAYPSRPIQFHTFPDSRLSSRSYFRFIASSCMAPNFPYKPFQGRTIHGMDLLSNYLGINEEQSVSPPPVSLGSDDVSLSSNSAEVFEETAGAPTEFMIFMGDFIYADVPVYWGDDKETYRRFYRRNYQSPSFRKIYEKLPVIHTYDDHEIINNYAGNSNDSQPPFPNADNAYELYNARANYDAPVEGQHYYEFNHGSTAFFVMDTRRYRSDILTEEPASRTMLGDQQLDALYHWLARVNNTATFKFIVSSVPFTTLWQHDALKDSWAAFEVEKRTLLDVLHTVPNVIMLTGDRHEFAAIEYNPDDHDHPGGHRIVEVSTSPLSMFYVPLIRTLKPKSDATVRKAKGLNVTNDDGSIESITIIEEVPQEQVIKHIAEGNYKWSTFEVDARDPKNPVVRLEVMIDGAKAYKLVIDGTPVKLPRTLVVAQSLLPESFKNILDRVGLKPSRWF